MQRRLGVYTRSGVLVADLAFPLEDFLLVQGAGPAARQLEWSADGELLAVLPCSQSSALLWSRNEADCAIVEAGFRVRKSPAAHLPSSTIQGYEIELGPSQSFGPFKIQVGLGKSSRASSYFPQVT